MCWRVVCVQLLQVHIERATCPCTEWMCHKYWSASLSDRRGAPSDLYRLLCLSRSFRNVDKIHLLKWKKKSGSNVLLFTMDIWIRRNGGASYICVLAWSFFSSSPIRMLWAMKKDSYTIGAFMHGLVHTHTHTHKQMVQWKMMTTKKREKKL